MVSGIQDFEKAYDMRGKLLFFLIRVSRIILKGENFATPSSIESGGVKEFSICVSFAKPLNSGLGFPEVLFTLKGQLIIFKNLTFQIVE